MIAADIARALGAAYRSGAWWRCRCPVHGSRGATLALRDTMRGLHVRCFGPCTPGQILAEIARRGLYSGDTGQVLPPDPETERQRAKVEATERQRRITLARDMWQSSLPAGGTIVERYLRGRLPGLDAIPETIRFIPPTAYYARHPKVRAGP
jgi:hypothetical protein